MPKEPLGRPKVLVRRHVLEVKEGTQAWIEEQLERFTDKRTYGKIPRVTGAAIAAAGVYVMVRLINQFGRDVAGAATGLAFDIATGISMPITNIFTSLFGLTVSLEEEEKTKVHEEITAALADLKGFDPFAFGAALTAGGMVLAGLNPGEILKGIGSIIDALIPL